MKKFLKIDDSNKVYFTHNFPFDEEHGLRKGEDELLLEGYLVDDIPEPEVRDGFSAIQYYDPVTNEFSFEYQPFEKSLTPEEEIATLKTKQTIMQAALDDIIMGGMM